MDPEEGVPEEVAEIGDARRNSDPENNPQEVISVIQDLDNKEAQQGALTMGDYLAREWARDESLRPVIGRDEGSRGRRKDLANQGIRGEISPDTLNAMKAQLDEEMFYGLVRDGASADGIDKARIEKLKITLPYARDLIAAIQKAESSK